jgi:ATP-binding cassette subfamily B multidrug efflux pump
MSSDVYEEQILGKAYDARLMRRLLTYIKPYRRSAYGAVFCLLAGSGFSVIQPFLTKVAIDRYIRNNNFEGLNGIAALYILTLILVFILSFGQTYLINLMGQKIMRDLRMEIFRHLQKLDVSFFDMNPVGRLMTRVTTDVDALNELFTSGVISIFDDICTLSGIIILLFWLNYRLALAIFLVLPFLVLATLLFKIKVRDSYRRVRLAIARINAFLQENLTGTAVVQIFGQEIKQYLRFTRINQSQPPVYFLLCDFLSPAAIHLGHGNSPHYMVWRLPGSCRHPHPWNPDSIYSVFGPVFQADLRSQ